MNPMSKLRHARRRPQPAPAPGPTQNEANTYRDEFGTNGTILGLSSGQYDRLIIEPQPLQPLAGVSAHKDKSSLPKTAVTLRVTGVSPATITAHAILPVDAPERTYTVPPTTRAVELPLPSTPRGVVMKLTLRQDNVVSATYLIVPTNGPHRATTSVSITDRTALLRPHTARERWQHLHPLPRLAGGDPAHHFRHDGSTRDGYPHHPYRPPSLYRTICRTDGKYRRGR